MFKKILDPLKGLFQSRIFIFGIFCLGLAILLIQRLFNLQIVNGESYLNTFTYRIQRDVEIPSARGNIYDTNGQLIAYNQLSYNITVGEDTALSDNATRNTMVNYLVEFIENGGSTVIDNIPIEITDSGEFRFTTSDVTRFKKDIYSDEDLSEAQENATAEEVFRYMRSDNLFNLDSSYSDQRALKIMAIRFEIYMKRYEKYQMVTVAKNVSDELVAVIMENMELLPGVSIEQDYIRRYNNAKYISNIIGYTGIISTSELSELEAEGITSYNGQDIIGKIGIESVYEDQLKGVKGNRTMYVNSLGSVLEVSEETPAQSGNDVYLSIDMDLQKKLYEMLEEKIAGILLNSIADGKVDYDNNEDFQIGIDEVCFALIDNGVLSLSSLSNEDATTREKTFYQKYSGSAVSTVNALEGYLRAEIQQPMNQLSIEYRDYFRQIFQMLSANDVLDTDGLNSSDEMYNLWNQNGSEVTISLGDFLKYAISQNRIDISRLDTTSTYLDSQEIYAGLVDYIVNNLPSYSAFQKRICYYMLENNMISGQEICILLYDQEVLPIEGDSDYPQLLSGTQTPYQFMYSKIYNMEITPDMLALEPCSGSAVFVDPNTGKVKALVSYPGYDSNRLDEDDYYLYLINNESRPLYNRPCLQLTAPGSTFKMVTASALLEEKAVTPETTIFDATEFSLVEPHAFCWSSNSHGTLNIQGAIRDSCNYFFYSAAYDMSLDANQQLDEAKGLGILNKYAAMFGLDRVSGLELEEQSPRISDTSVVRSAIGQGTNNFSAAQLARYISTVANRGTVYDLSLVERVESPTGTVVETVTPKVVQNLNISSTTWNNIQSGMYQVCNESYLQSTFTANVEIAGKSGTAQESELHPNHGLFVGYAPYSSPEIVATVVIPNGHGSSNVAALYNDMMAYYFHENTGSTETQGRTASIPSGSTTSGD